MSKNIIIQEGGNNKQMTAAKLKTSQVGGGSVLWVPEDEVQLMTKSISENGTYAAEDEGKYGYSVVTVNVPGGSGSANSDGTPSGTTPPGGSGSAVVGEDSNGNDSVVGVDENGKLVTTPLPSKITVTVYPTKMEYTEGENIAIAGAFVVARNEDGTAWENADYPNGVIPVSEITVSPTIAEIVDNMVHTELTVSPLLSDFYYGKGTEFRTDPDTFTASEECFVTSLSVFKEWVGAHYGFCFFANDHPFEVFKNGEPYASAASGELYGLRLYYRWIGWSREIAPVYNTETDSDGADQRSLNIAFAMVHEGADSFGKQTITLSWNRPADGKTLQTTLEVSVSNAENTEGDSGGTFETEGGGEHTSSGGGF